MIQLDRHIEILLLSNDCVIVPNLGGFMAHHVEARFDAQDNQFLPPQRTLGFNPKLALNDNLLAQSYAEAYDLSYPEAITRIEEEVAQLKQQLFDEGYYELTDIGTLRIVEDGHFDFQPCEAGILTPEFYGLSSFEFKPKQDIVPATKSLLMEKQDITPNNKFGQNSEVSTISIRVSVLRNALAIVAAVIAFFLITTPLGIDSMKQMTHRKQTASMLSALTEKEPSYDMLTATVPAGGKAADKEATRQEAKATAKDTSHYWQLVLATGVSRSGAERYVSELANRGLTEGAVLENQGSWRKVVYGHYPTEAEARSQLVALRENHADFGKAWLLEIK